jgi:ethanolamine utilization protein EutP (predicted NTPase)
MNEFTNLFDMGKVIGVLTKTDGIADEFERLNKIIKKPGKAKVIFNDDPEELIDMVLAELSQNN